MLRNTRAASGIALALLFFTAADLRAQGTEPETPWSVEGNIGWDNSISGNVFSAGIGTINGVSAVVEDRSYDDVYGTGINFNFGVGYALTEQDELRGNVTIQNVSADIVQMGTLGGSPLFATFDDYSVFALDFGYRRYFAVRPKRLRPFGGGTIGVAIIDEIDADLAAPQLGVTLNATDFYDGTAAFTIGFNGGVAFAITPRLDGVAQLGLRYTGGLSEIDGLRGTGLEDINDDSGRWTLPLTFGVRFQF